jgi:hypothetical protein
MWQIGLGRLFMSDGIRDLGWSLCGVGALLRRLGGFHWKWLWRYAGPVILGVMAYAYGVKWWRCLITVALMILSNSLGYEGAWAKGVRVLLLIGQGALAGASLWPLTDSWKGRGVVGVICTLAWPALLALSNNWPYIPHGLVESAWGFILYGCAAWLIVERP